MRASPALLLLMLAGAGAARTGSATAPRNPATAIDTPYVDSASIGRERALGALDDIPRVTLLYQNFPNPFPNAGVFVTCVWFDLARDARPSLQVLDIRGNLVRVLLPRPDVPAILPAGRHGRGPGGSDPGCDPRFTWDGRAASGEFVPPGVYLVRLKADGTESYKKILFRGR